MELVAALTGAIAGAVFAYTAWAVGCLLGDLTVDLADWWEKRR